MRRENFQEPAPFPTYPQSYYIRHLRPAIAGSRLLAGSCQSLWDIQDKSALLHSFLAYNFEDSQVDISVQYMTIFLGGNPVSFFSPNVQL